jgi:hypothetical protein
MTKLNNSQTLRNCCPQKQVDRISEKPKPIFVGTKRPTSDIFEKSEKR